MQAIPSLFVPSAEASRITTQPCSRSKTKCSMLVRLAISPCLSGGRYSIEIAAAQKKTAGFAHHFAARVAHLCAAIGAIAGNVGLMHRLRRLLNNSAWIGLIFIGHQCSHRSVTLIFVPCILKTTLQQCCSGKHLTSSGRACYRSFLATCLGKAAPLV